MLKGNEIRRTSVKRKWIFFLMVGFLVSTFIGVRSVRAVADRKIDLPNPKVAPLTSADAEIPDLTSLVETYSGPGNYVVDILADQQASVEIRWCTKTAAILTQNLEQIQFSFDLNSSNQLSKLHNFEEVDQDASGETMYCHGYRGLLNDWPVGEHKISYGLTFAASVNDGWDNYPAGEISWEYVVTVTAAGEATSDVPTVSVSLNTNCRMGPGKAYEIVSALRVGETADVVGKYPASNYWIIFEPNIGRQCWLWGKYAEVIGDTSQLKVYTPPPLPTATPTPTPVPVEYSICFCNNTGGYISAIRLFNDDTDQWVGKIGSDGLPSGYCICNCQATSGPFPPGDYAIQYKVCNDGVACQSQGDPILKGFEITSQNQMYTINP